MDANENELPLDVKIKYIENISKKLKIFQACELLKFLLTINLFENSCFEGNGELTNLEKINEKLNNKWQNDENLKTELSKFKAHFKNRYKNYGKEKFIKDLEFIEREKETAEKLYGFLQSNEEEPSTNNNGETILYCLLLCYRFRNNLFHGNKSVESAAKYSAEYRAIKKFLFAVMRLMDKK